MWDLQPRPLLAVVSIAVGLGAGPVAATAATDDDGRWHFHAVPYLWLPALEASADVTLARPRGADGVETGPVRLSTKTTPDNYLSDLNMAFMFMGEARKGPWSVYTDLLYTSFGNEKTRVRNRTGPAGFVSTDIDRTARTDLSATVWTLAGGYRAIERSTFELDLMAGFRYLSMDSDLELSLQGTGGRFSRQRKVSMDQDFWDGIIGLRGRVLFPGSDWFMPYYADVGTGGSNLTWQAMLGVGYRFDWGEVTLAYRALGYDFDRNDADLRLDGPGLAVGFRW